MSLPSSAHPGDTIQVGWSRGLPFGGFTMHLQLDGRDVSTQHVDGSSGTVFFSVQAPGTYRVAARSDILNWDLGSSGEIKVAAAPKSDPNTLPPSVRPTAATRNPNTASTPGVDSSAIPTDEKATATPELTIIGDDPSASVIMSLSTFVSDGKTFVSTAFSTVATTSATGSASALAKLGDDSSGLGSTSIGANGHITPPGGSQPTGTDTTPATTPSSDPPPSGAGSKSKTPMIVGTILGILFFLLGILLLLYLCRRKLRNRRNRKLGTFNNNLMVRQRLSGIPPSRMFDVDAALSFREKYDPEKAALSSHAAGPEPEKHGFGNAARLPDNAQNDPKSNTTTPRGPYAGTFDNIYSTDDKTSHSLPILTSQPHPPPPLIIMTPATPPQPSDSLLMAVQPTSPSPPSPPSALSPIPTERIGEWTDKQIAIHDKIMELQMKITEIERLQGRKY